MWKIDNVLAESAEEDEELLYKSIFTGQDARKYASA